MIPLLTNPVYHSLLYNDRHLGFEYGNAMWFDEAVSPFAGFEDGYKGGFRDLYNALPAGRQILYANPRAIVPPKYWRLLAAVKGLQFLYESNEVIASTLFKPTHLGQEHLTQMMELTALTKPGPFGPRTPEFGHYYGVLEEGRLAAMTGQRLHINAYTEISAVCTHPAFLGKGYASALVQHQVALILQNGQVPFLHVRADNERAIALYKRIGFKEQGPMNFYFLEK